MGSFRSGPSKIIHSWPTSRREVEEVYDVRPQRRLTFLKPQPNLVLVFASRTRQVPCGDHAVAGTCSVGRDLRRASFVRDSQTVVFNVSAPG